MADKLGPREKQTIHADEVDNNLLDELFGPARKRMKGGLWGG